MKGASRVGAIEHDGVMLAFTLAARMLQGAPRSLQRASTFHRGPVGTGPVQPRTGDRPPDPAQRHRLEEIRANLLDRIAEAEREGWLGEVEGLQVSLAGADDKLTQITASLRRTANAVQLGMPAFPGIAGRSSSDKPVVKDAP